MPRARRSSIVSVGGYRFSEERRNFAEVLKELPRLVSYVDGENERPVEQIRTSVTSVVVDAVCAIQSVLAFAEKEIVFPNSIRRGVRISEKCILLRSGSFDTFGTKVIFPKGLTIPGDNSLEIVEWLIKFLSTLSEALDYAEVQWKERNEELRNKTAELLEFKIA